MEKGSLETPSSVNGSFSVVDHDLEKPLHTRCKTNSKATASVARPPRDCADSVRVSRQHKYLDADQVSFGKDATSALWVPNAGGPTSSLRTTDEASSTKGGDGFAMPSPQTCIPTIALARYVRPSSVGDAAPVIVRGHKYVFNNRTRRWLAHHITVRVLHHNRGIHQDKYFATFAVELLDLVKPATPMLAKVYRHNIDLVSETDYYSLGQAQALCEEFARDYTRTAARSHYVKFHLPLLTNRVVVRLDMDSVLDPAIRTARKGFFSYRTQDTRQVMFLMEPNTVACEALGISFASREVDEGKCYSRGDAMWSRDIYRDIADGFSHFTYVRSRMCMVAHGFMRSNGYLLDPLFHTTDSERFTMGDAGRSAMEDWVEGHRCGDTCRALGISNFNNDGECVKTFAACVNPLDTEENHYTDFLRSVRQMRVIVHMDAAEILSDYKTDSAVDTVSESSDWRLTMAVLQPAPVSPAPLKVTCDAVKYVFLPTRAKWMEVPMRLTVSASAVPDTVDGTYAFFAIEEEREGGRPVPMRARFLLRPEARDADYYHFGDAYCVCVTLGQAFREYRASNVCARELDFYAAYAVRVPQANIPDCIKAAVHDSDFFTRTTADSGDVMFVAEPEFQSFSPRCSPNADGVTEDAAGFDDLALRHVVDAFSHFTLHKSGNHLLVCHFKCQGGLLMHPNINTSSGCGFETLNDGQAGIDAWARAHTCNDVCKLLGMEPLPRELKLYDISSSPLMRYIRHVQEHKMGSDEMLELASPSRRMSDAMLPAASDAAARQSETASASSSATASTATAAVASFVRPTPPTSEETMLRPWVKRGCKPSAASAKETAAQRRTLTQEELMRLQSKGIDTKYIIPATRYDLDIDDFTWTPKRIFVRIVNPERGIGQGGMRVCFEVADVDPDTCKESVMVAKMYRRTIKHVVEKDYFMSVTVQKLSSLFAKDFNKERREGRPLLLNVLDSAVIALNRADLSAELLAKRTGFFSYRTEDTERVVFCVEERLLGRFTKYNGNMGEAYPTNECRLSPPAARERTMVFEAVEALSHYSLERSEGGLLVCDMQGVRNDLTDLEVHSYDGQGLDMGNFGARGIEKFALRHRCTSVCKSLNLRNLRDRHFVVTDDVKTKNRFVALFERIKEIGNMEE
ncbi:related to elongation factor-2 kinase efk-1b isoform-like protein [Leishmania major strain Friedlin]|uniref:Related to elongation factor-2 kinase efk-1b isoform-like protein n=1 Tax=Leishmania major TaxID=5664 RepID=Q4Q0V9_LEIMA|nr:related to elongation factor-2 kinase efk-1b isoform-like protein [Leishmania major strain Friedlin]CAG9584002.1 elongation_factor-2_kinase-like_protein [Leishmania major strain Friedlin]CAJ09422.1 related to elongation factor-2 kinase efk-1b isoform-like protein [Leishmania major strain Friedlin]|eukprot:XP_001687039.1 related to elongation factor-2 kinase efk-1b isoform-like protein [Leishmania major strain Friedlin]